VPMRKAAAITTTTTTTMMTTTIDPAPLLHLLAWLSPAFPTGAFAYSHGLEWAVEAGDVTDGASLQEWLEDVLAHGAGRSDTILLRHAHRNAADPGALREIAALAVAATPARERQDEALNQGRAFLLAVAAWGISLPADLPYAVAVGATAGVQGIDEDDTAVAYVQTFAGNLISAAVRLVPLGQTAGLRVLAALEPKIINVAQETRSAALDDLGGCAFRSDIAAMRHETQYTRLFRS
jgi:urease accessory protein